MLIDWRFRRANKRFLLPTPSGSRIKAMSKQYIEQREGGFYVAGTRVSLDSLIHAFRRGESPETICQNFEVLQLEEVYGAITYYLADQAIIDAYLVGQEQKWVDGKQASQPLPDGLRERLARVRDGMHTSSPS